MSLLDWIYPPRCMACHNPLPLNEPRRRIYYLCAHCETMLEPLSPPLCPRCGYPMEIASGKCPSCVGKTLLYAPNISAYAYEGLIREAIHEMKFRNRKYYAKGMGALLADACQGKISQSAALVPVPMFRRKKRRRGFNQAEEMGQVLSKRLGVPMKDILIRVRETPPQSGLSAHRRAENMEGAFCLNPEYEITHQFFYLIDDIHTTGATLNACAKTLLDGGAEGIGSITFALVVKNKKV